MNFNFSAWSIRNPIPAILLFFVLLVVGITSFNKLPIEQFPNIDVPIIAVTVAQSGSTPSELETQVTKIVEDAVAGISGVKHISSTLSDGSSVTATEFRLEVPTQKALQDVKDAVARIRGNLPAGVDEPIIQSVDVEGQAIQTYAVKAPGMTLEQLSWYVDDVVKRQMQSINGVGRVDRYGGVDREIRINLEPQKLQSYGITAAQVNSQLAATNADFGAGKGDIGGFEQAIRTLGGAKTLNDLKDTKIVLAGGRYARLGDLGSVEDSSSEQKSFARYNGESVVTFSIFRAKGASSTEVAKRVTDKIASLTTDSKGAASFSLVDDTVYFIYGNYKAAMEGLIEGALLAVLVVLIFLRNIRATLISAVALPLSAFPTFWVMSLLGFSLNLVSFLAITLATGILVDDAIVEIENIARHMRMGKTPYRASMEAADEIGLAVIAITMSIISIFVPVSFMSGIAGQYFKQFGMTVAVAVFFSLIVARLITPMMAAYLMKPIPHEEHKPGLLMRTYVNLLHMLNLEATTLSTKWLWIVALVSPLPGIALTFLRGNNFVAVLHGTGITFAFSMLEFFVLSVAYLGMIGGVTLLITLVTRSIYRLVKQRVIGGSTSMAGGGSNLMSYATVATSFGVLLVAMQLFPLLPSGFIPKDDNSRFVLSVELPPGTKLEDTKATTDGMAKIIRQNPEVTQVFVLGGASPTGTAEPRRASIYVNLRHRDVGILPNMWNPLASRLHLPQVAWDGRVKSQSAIEDEVLPKLSNLPDVQWAKINPRGAREVEFNMLSTDPVALRKAAGDLEAALRKNPKLRAPMSQGALTRPELQITPKTAEAAQLGVTAQAISQAVRVATIGDFGPLLAKFSDGDRQIPIRVQIPESARTSFSEIANLKLPTSSGVTVPLSSVADVRLAEGPSTVKRFDRQRQATIGADLPPGVELGEGSKIIEDTAAGISFPKNVTIQKGGDAEVQGEVQTGFVNAASIGVILMLCVLVLLLGNVFMPFAILLSLPLSLGGVVMALLITHQAFSMPVIIGMLMLMGIVAKNAIMLIDFAVERKKHGMERVEAVIDAGLKRARPIVMTTIAMGAGMFPTALGIGEGGSFRAPMATAVIGGLIVSTFLSLIFVPSYYVVMDDVARLFSWIFRRFVGARDEPKVVDADVAAVDAKVEHVGTEVDGLAAKLDAMEERVAALAKPSATIKQFKPAAE